MWHIFKGLHIFFDFDGVGERFDSIFILVFGRKKTVWNCNGRPVLGVYHCRMGGYSSNKRRVRASGQGCDLNSKPKRGAPESVGSEVNDTFPPQQSPTTAHLVIVPFVSCSMSLMVAGIFSFAFPKLAWPAKKAPKAFFFSSVSGGIQDQLAYWPCKKSGTKTWY